MLALVACGGAEGEAPQRPPPLTGTDSLITNFRAQGTALEIIGPVRRPFFAVESTEVHLRGAPVQIFQIPSAAAAAEGIEDDGIFGPQLAG